MARLTAVAALSFLAAPAFAGVRWVAPDFYVDDRAVFRVEGAAAAPADCGGQLASKICVVEGEDRHCAEGGAAYGAPLKALYDKYPPALRAMFCSVVSIFIEAKLNSTAYGGIGADGPKIGIRRSVLDQGLSLSKWATWKEQLPFGGSKTSYDDPKPELPTVSASAPGVKDDALFLILAHELGHILDFSRGLDRDGTWPKLSWTFAGLSRYEPVFPLRRKLDFYGDGPRLGADQIENCYGQLGFTDYATLYASTNPYDDFAESVAHATLLGNGGSYAVKLPSGKLIDSKERLESDRFAAKRAFVSRELNSSPAVKAALW